MIRSLPCLAAFGLLASPAQAQVAVGTDAVNGSTAVVPIAGAGGRQVKAAAVVVIGADGAAVAVSKQESFKLVASNVPSAAAGAYGGSYILSQTCSTYGTLALQILGPDGATYQTVLTKTAADTTGGTAVSLGSLATVRVTVTGTTGCNAILARVPA